MGQRDNNQRDNNFLGGFLAGTLLGGVLGGIVGAAIASRYRHTEDEYAENDGLTNGDYRNDRPVDPSNNDRPRRRFLRDQPSEDRIEAARRSLEGKIAQLNEAIDDVRQQLEDRHPQEGKTRFKQNRTEEP